MNTDFCLAHCMRRELFMLSPTELLGKLDPKQGCESQMNTAPRLHAGCCCEIGKTHYKNTEVGQELKADYTSSNVVNSKPKRICTEWILK